MMEPQNCQFYIRVWEGTGAIMYAPVADPLVHASRLSDAEARIAELEATIEQMKADHACEVADMATRFRAVNVERLSERLKVDIFTLRDRAEAAEADKTALLQAIKHHSGSDHGLLGIRLLVERAAEAGDRALEEAAKVVDGMAEGEDYDNARRESYSLAAAAIRGLKEKP